MIEDGNLTVTSDVVACQIFIRGVSNDNLFSKAECIS